ncbi:MAG: Bax inhibitor-1/YccA family protein [Alphaproteobacteria bacterium]|jgi:FtsH-binding integral membrane protein|nr:Bax inhibitor-1/YccA family protein [Alphaproteobacteria bacterium]MBP7729057.1 Bax inhibitor-1/YccA family protein [Alphaproteobacteria bacterium]
MSDRSKNRTILGVERRSLAYSAGLRAYMLSIYNYMALGLGLTGGVALLVVSSPTLLHAIQPFMLLFVIAPVALVLFLSFKINTMQFSTAQAVFWLYAALNGVAFSVIFLQFTYESIARVFFITGGMFAAMSLYGYTTKKDLTAWGSFLFMGLIGIIIASLVNIFIASSMLQFMVSVAGVIIFTGLTAYDTQSIKEGYVEGSSTEIAGKRAIFGALRLYLDFINLFLIMLRLFGDRR